MSMTYPNHYLLLSEKIIEKKNSNVTNNPTPKLIIIVSRLKNSINTPCVPQGPSNPRLFDRLPNTPIIQNPILERKKILRETFHNLNFESNATRAIPSIVTMDAIKAYFQLSTKTPFKQLINYLILCVIGF